MNPSSANYHFDFFEKKEKKKFHLKINHSDLLMIQMTNPNMSQQMSNQPNQNNYAQLIKTFKNSTTSTNPDVMSFIKNDPKMMAALIRTQQHPSQQQQQHIHRII